MEQKKEKGLRIRSCLTGAIWLALVFSTVISALLFAFLNHFFNLPGSIPVLGWLLIFNTLIAGLITSFINAKLLEPITRLSKAMKEVSQGDFEQHLETNSRIAEVGESYQSFNVMTKELRATEVLQMDFVSNVSHEFKTPINAIEGYTMLLQGEELSPDQEEYVEKILFNTQRLSGLVGNILLLSKLENQNIPMKKTEYRLDEQIRQAFLSLETKWTEKEIGFQVELEEVKYTGNEGLFMHIWINLLDNAIKFSPSKGTITMFLKQEQDSVKFILEDEGPGIEDDVKSRIFDKFYQVDGSHKAEGNGLGLALVKRIVDSAGGTIKAENRSRLYDPLQGALQNLAAVISTRTNIARMNEILDHPIQQGSDRLSNQGYDIVFDHVGFAYNTGETVLKDVSFTAKQGEVTALVGPSGGGKTTVSRLAARFWDINRGKITVGGMDVSRIDQETLLSLYSIVFQDVTLFDNTILENIRIGNKDATDEQVIAAAKLANVDEFAKKLPDGWHTNIGENGCELSGGERQRISIARAFLKNAPIILLDEATASLDVENETLIQTALSRLIADKTVLVIAHRMRTVAGADKIVVLSDGTVAEEGSPKDLEEKNGVYAHMVKLQTESQNWKLA